MTPFAAATRSHDWAAIGRRWWSAFPAPARDLVWYVPLLAAGAGVLLADGAPAGAGDVALLLLGPAPVLLRRAFPRVALVSSAAMLVGLAALGRDSSVAVTTLAVVIVMVVASDARLPAVVVFVVAAVASNAAVVLDGHRLTQPVQPASFIFGTFGTALAIGLGVLLRRHRQALAELAERNAELAERNAELDRLRVSEARRAVADERKKIARELHDVVAHHVAGIAVRAAAAAHVHRNRPEQAVAALTYVAQAAGETLTALRRMVGVLREDGPPPEPEVAAYAPQPDLSQLPRLVAGQRAAGQAVELTETGTPVAPAADVQLAVYRIVQESLTNAMRHAPGAPVQVTLGWEPGTLTVKVDNGRAAGPSGPPMGLPGHGLVGMRERAELSGGSLTAGPADSGWRVVARLPLAAAREPAR